MGRRTQAATAAVGVGALAAALASVAALAAPTAPTAVTATSPMALLLAKAHGIGKVELSSPTTRLHGGIWIYRRGGSGVARGSAAVSCSTKSRFGTNGTDTWFKFTLQPGRRQALWRHSSGSGSCIVDVSLTGKGLLRVELRGY